MVDAFVFDDLEWRCLVVGGSVTGVKRKSTAGVASSTAPFVPYSANR
jgi:hypothetical protein